MKNTIKNKSTDMNGNHFWDDLLEHIREQVLVPVVGPDLTVVKVGADHIHTRFARLDTSFFLLGSGGGSTKQIEIALSHGADLKLN